MSRLLALPPDLLEAVVALVPEQGCGEEEGERGFSCEGNGFCLWASSQPLEATCRRLRSVALALPPARLALHFDVDQAAAGIDMHGLLRRLRRRPPPLHLEIADVPAGIPPAAWDQLAAPLLSGARQLFVQGGDLDALLEGARCFMRLQSLTVWPSDCVGDGVAPLPNPATLRALTTLTSVDLHCEPLPAELAAALASLPQLQSARLQGWEPPADDSGAWQQLAALGSRLRGLHFVLGDAAANEDVPAVLPPGLLALTAAGSIALDIYPGWDEQQPGLPGLDRLPGVDSVTMWHTFNPPEVWRCSNLRSLEFHNATAGVALPHDAQPAAHLTQLTSLSLVYACFDGGRLPPPLCSLPRLQALRVDHCGFSELQLPLQASLLTALRQLSLGRLTLSTDSCAALASIPALTKLRFSECTLADLPSGPYQSALRELSLIGSSQVAGQELPPPSISGASQLTALHCSLHTFSPETLRTQWPVFLATLQALPNLEYVSASVAPKQNSEAAAVHELLCSLFADSGLGCALKCVADFYK